MFYDRLITQKNDATDVCEMSDPCLLEIKASQQAMMDEFMEQMKTQQKINQELREQNFLMANAIINQEHTFVKRTSPPVVQGL